MDNFWGSLSRRRFLQGTAVVGGALCVGSGYWGALARAQEIRAPRRLAPNDGLSLAEYIVREAPKMDFFPCGLLGSAFVRFRAALTFERYLKYYRFKEKAASSTREEIDDCIRHMDDFSVKAKALVFAATSIFILTHCRDYETAYRNWQKRVKYAPLTPVTLDVQRRSKSLSPDYYCIEKNVYFFGRRDYYPYCYPALGGVSNHRSLLILGAPNPDPRVDETWRQEKMRILNQYKWNEEIAFPSLIKDEEETPTDDFIRIARRLGRSPLQFLVFTNLHDGGRDFPYPNLDAWPKEPSSDCDREVGKYDERDPKIWFKWFKNIEKCVAIIRRELDLTVPPERWISDYYPDADAFLQKIAEVESDESTPFEKVELLTALREYWISMQISFNFDLKPASSPATSVLLNPFCDVLDYHSLRLKDVALDFCASF